MATALEDAQRKKVLLQETELMNWGRNRYGNSWDYLFYVDHDPYEAQNGPCSYGEELWNKFVNQDAPINNAIRNSHDEWVSNRRAWSGVSKYLQDSIPVVVDWRGIRTPEPTPQSCNRSELTEYGPADLVEWITETRKRTGQPVMRPNELAGCFRTAGTGVGCGSVPFSLYGF